MEKTAAIDRAAIAAVSAEFIELSVGFPAVPCMLILKSIKKQTKYAFYSAAGALEFV